MFKNRYKKIYFFISSIFIFLIHLPFVFAKIKPLEILQPIKNKQSITLPKDSTNAVNVIKANNNLFNNVYDGLKLNLLGLSKHAFQIAIQGFDKLVQAGKVTNNKIISIIDFSEPSSKKRLFVIDLAKNKLVFNTYVAHGMNSGKEYASQFSNFPESNMSSLGFYETKETYIGKNGYSLHLEGLEKGINDNADSRSIVIHGAKYVNKDYIQSQGYIGRSWGCPAVSEELHKPIIDKIKNGTCLFIYSPDKNYFIHSKIVKEAKASLVDNLN